MSEQKSSNIIHPDDYGAPKQPGKIIKQTDSPRKIRIGSLDKLLKDRKRLALIIGVVVVVIGLIIGINIYHNHSAKKKTEIAQYNEMINQVDLAETRSEHALAKSLLLGFLAAHPNNPNKNQVNQIYAELGVVYANQKDYKNAIDAQNKALQSAPSLTFAQYFNLAEVCERGGDKTCAINNYKLALTRLNDVSAASRDPYSTYIQAHIKMMGG